MTYSPIISAAGAAPDSAAAPVSSGVAAAGAAPALTGQAGHATAPAGAVPAPADAAPDPGTSPGQLAEPAPDATYPYTYAATDPAGSTAGSAGYADSAADPAGSTSDFAGSSADAADSASGYGEEDEAGTAWPHQTFLELGALPTAAPCARLHTTLVLWEWELGSLVRTAGLVVSELVSNAVQASAALTGSRFSGQWAPGTPPVRVWLSADDHRVVIQVWDGSDRPPVPQAVAPEADSGRGLLLVGSLSAEWGCYTPEKSSGKVVWAVVTG